MREIRNWPSLRHYDQGHLNRIALPLGGIGTGTVSLGGRGDLRDWEVANRPAKGFTPENTFFALWAKPDGAEAITRALEGPLEVTNYEGAFGANARCHGLPRFKHASFDAAYPLGQVALSDPDVPVGITLKAFNPLIPCDAERSGLPVAVLSYVLTNDSDISIDISICGNLQNFIASEGQPSAAETNTNTYRKEDNMSGLYLETGSSDSQAEQWGTMALCAGAIGAKNADTITHRTSWADFNWGDALLDFWDDFSSDGRLEARDRGQSKAPPMASLAVSSRLQPHSAMMITFLLTWHFPNRRTWTPAPSSSPVEASPSPGLGCPADPNIIGNYYTTQFRDAWDVATYVSAQIDSLEADTLKFVKAFCESDLPIVVKEAALFNSSTLRTQTCFRTPDGFFYGWEGCGDNSGSCHGSCTHVWNYEVATSSLFGNLSESMRRVEFDYDTNESGLMNFRAPLPLGRAGHDPDEFHFAAADGQMGCVMRLYRDWRLSGDMALLRDLWPKAKKAVEFCWIAGGWDADKDGTMEGCQHNTMDVEYYGPNPQMETWYLGALRAAQEMATYVGDDEFAAICLRLFKQGSQWMDDNLFNGEYYEHQITPHTDGAAIAPRLRIGMGATSAGEPDFQLGAGCLVDQLAGQYMAHVCGLGYLLDPEHIATTLQSIMRYNFRSALTGHFNHLRSFALGDEAGLLMATYPKGRRPMRPFPYFNEIMTGFEYTAAAGMLYEGLGDDGLKVVQSIRDRYDGQKRSPFDEAECGHHYARAMASWALVLALTGFQYDALHSEIQFHSTGETTSWFWSTGRAWGIFQQSKGSESGGSINVVLDVLYGHLNVQRISLTGAGCLDFGTTKVLMAGSRLSGQVNK